MGIGTILEARKIVLLAFGEHKAAVVRKAVEEEPSDAIAASFLQRHLDATFILDEAAAAELTAVRQPWLFGPCELDTATHPPRRAAPEPDQ
jgi:glucosamine-6-phosphate deaminase